MATPEGILKLRGQWRDFDTGTRVIKAMATLHPAYLLRQPLQKRLAWRDFLTLRTALRDRHAPSRADEHGGAFRSMTEREATIRSYVDEVFNRHDLLGLDKYWSDDLVSHWLGDRTLRGLPAWKEGMAGFLAAFPDAAYTLEDLFFAGDKGVWRGSWQATHRGVFEGIAATGRKASWTVIIIGRFTGGKLAEDWVEFDRLTLLRQLGAIPP